MGTKRIWDGDQLPPVGSEVLIRLSSMRAWVRHVVAGYRLAPSIRGPDDTAHHRIFVQLSRSDDPRSWENERLLKDVRPLDHLAKGDEE